MKLAVLPATVLLAGGAFALLACQDTTGTAPVPSGGSAGAMGESYKELLADRTLLLVQLQAYAACSDPVVKDTVRREFAQLYRYVVETSGATPEDVHHFFAEGMLLNVAAALELGGTPETWSLSGLLGTKAPVGGSGGAS